MFELPQLPYSKNSLEGFISEETFDYHHGKHHTAYISKLNTAIENTNMADMTLENIILLANKEGKQGIFNNAAQHYNHSFFWECFSADGGREPAGILAKKIESTFDSFSKFKEKFSTSAATLFGSGWIWLAQNNDRELEILSMRNAGTPLTDDKTPILTIDVWEHAYYIDHKNARANYIEKFWDFVDWEKASKKIQ